MAHEDTGGFYIEAFVQIHLAERPAALGAEGDSSKARTAIEHASMAILSLSKEVA